MTDYQLGSLLIILPGFAKVLLHLDFPIQIVPGTSFWVELNKFGYTMIY